MWHRRKIVPPSAFLCALLLGASGCQVTSPQRNVSQDTQANMAVTQNQTRLRMRSLVDPMCGQIEETADAIMAGTTDRNVDLAALKWKIDGVPAMREALFQPDWATAASDTLVLCIQMADYFEAGAGKDELGPASAQAAATCRRMQEEFTHVLASATTSGDVSQVSAIATDWAAEHPIRRSISDRPSTLSRIFEREFSETMSAGQAIAEVTTTLDDLNRKIEVYSDQLFRQARWETERLKMQLLSELRAEEAIPLAERAVASAEQAEAALDRVASSLEGALKVAEDVPRLMASEREAAVQVVHEELRRTNEFIREERITALDQLTQERVLALKELNETFAQHRQQATLDADQITGKRIDYVMQQVARLVVYAIASVIVTELLVLLAARWFLVRRPA